MAVLVHVVGMAVHPGLADHVDAVRSAICGCAQVGVAHGALGDFRRVPLQLGGIHVVICLEGGEFRMRRAVAGRAEHRSVTQAITIEIGSLHRDVGVGGESLILGGAPLTAAGERGFVAQAVVVAHLAGGFNEPSGAGRVPDVTDVAVATRAVDLVHGAALAQSLGTGMANVAGGQVGFPLIQGGSAGVVRERSMQCVHIRREWVDPGEAL